MNFVGNFLAKTREGKGQSRKDVSERLAKITGMKNPNSVVYQIEKNLRRIPAKRVDEFAEVYQLSEEEKKEVLRLMSQQRVLDPQELQEIEMVYNLLKFPKDARTRICSIVMAYNSMEK